MIQANLMLRINEQASSCACGCIHNKAFMHAPSDNFSDILLKTLLQVYFTADSLKVLAFDCRCWAKNYPAKNFLLLKKVHLKKHSGGAVYCTSCILKETLHIKSTVTPYIGISLDMIGTSQ